jgi:phosphoribosyl 1,2-cyclic phosphodiesterase
MKFCVLASGSKGNSIFIETQYSRILVDVGLSANKISQRLKKIDVEPGSITSIVITHAHSDHVRGVGQFAFKYDIPIYGHPETLDAITHRLKTNPNIVPWTREFQIKDASFTPFRLSHDCEPTHGFLIRERFDSLAICVDLGVATDNVRQALKSADTLILESNHDLNMLMTGRYSWPLKERIASRIGHLSNREAGLLLKQVVGARHRRIILGHLSEENNTAEIVWETVLDSVGLPLESMIHIIEQKQMSPVFAV